LDEDGDENASSTIFNIIVDYPTQSEDGKRNLPKKQFEENNKFNRLVDVCKFLISQQPSSQEQRHVANNISLAICNLLKSEKPPLSFSIVLTYCHNLKSSPSLPSGYDISLDARNAWNWMKGVDDCLSSFKK
jgi:hypothetical protein